jgi:hypothetical protein
MPYVVNPLSLPALALVWSGQLTTLAVTSVISVLCQVFPVFLSHRLKIAVHSINTDREKVAGYDQLECFANTRVIASRTMSSIDASLRGARSACTGWWNGAPAFFSASSTLCTLFSAGLTSSMVDMALPLFHPLLFSSDSHTAPMSLRLSCHPFPPADFRHRGSSDVSFRRAFRYTVASGSLEFSSAGSSALGWFCRYSIINPADETMRSRRPLILYTRFSAR